MTQYTVLIAEDSPDVRQLLASLFRQNGYQVIETSHGQEVLTSLQSQHPDIVLLDLSMPFLDGWATLSAIRALPDGDELPVVAITAHVMKGDAEAILAHGFNAYISKPFGLRSLLDTVKQLLQQEQTVEL